MIKRNPATSLTIDQVFIMSTHELAEAHDAEIQVSADNIADKLANPFGFKRELIESIYVSDNGQQGKMPAYQGLLAREDNDDALEYVRVLNNPGPNPQKGASAR